MDFPAKQIFVSPFQQVIWLEKHVEKSFFIFDVLCFFIMDFITKNG